MTFGNFRYFAGVGLGSSLLFLGCALPNFGNSSVPTVFPTPVVRSVQQVPLPTQRIINPGDGLDSVVESQFNATPTSVAPTAVPTLTPATQVPTLTPTATPAPTAVITAQQVAYDMFDSVIQSADKTLAQYLKVQLDNASFEDMVQYQILRDNFDVNPKIARIHTIAATQMLFLGKPVELSDVNLNIEHSLEYIQIHGTEDPTGMITTTDSMAYYTMLQNPEIRAQLLSEFVYRSVARAIADNSFPFMADTGNQMVYEPSLKDPRFVTCNGSDVKTLPDVQSVLYECLRNFRFIEHPIAEDLRKVARGDLLETNLKPRMSDRTEQIYLNQAKVALANAQSINSLHLSMQPFGGVSWGDAVYGPRDGYYNPSSLIMDTLDRDWVATRISGNFNPNSEDTIYLPKKVFFEVPGFELRSAGGIVQKEFIAILASTAEYPIKIEPDPGNFARYNRFNNVQLHSNPDGTILASIGEPALDMAITDPYKFRLDDAQNWFNGWYDRNNAGLYKGNAYLWKVHLTDEGENPWIKVFGNLSE